MQCGDHSAFLRREKNRILGKKELSLTKSSGLSELSASLSPVAATIISR
jgi:hypothetical protein